MDEDKVMRYVGAVTFGTVSLLLGHLSVGELMDGYSRRNTIRNAFYEKADKITPEVIEQAERAINPEYKLIVNTVAAVTGTLAGLCGVVSAALLIEAAKSDRKN